MGLPTAFIVTVALVVASLRAFQVIGAELRSHAVLGLVLCVLLMAGVLWRPTRWFSCSATALLLGAGYLLWRQQ